MTRLPSYAGLVLVLFTLPGRASDLPETKRDCLTRAAVDSPNQKHWFENCLIDLATLQPIHPVFESIAPGSGFGAGLGFDSKPHAGRFESAFSIKAVMSVDGSFLAGASYQVGFPSLSIGFQNAPAGQITAGSNASDTTAPCQQDRQQRSCETYVRRLALVTGNPEIDSKALLTFHAQHTQLNQQDYYGEGQFTTQSGWSRYSMRSNNAGFTFVNPVTTWLAPAVSFDYLKPDVGGVTGQARPSIGTFYTESTAPGLTARPAFTRAEPQVRLRFQLPPVKGHFPLVPDVTQIKLGYAFDHDTGGKQYSFRQFHGFVQTSAEILIYTGKTDANRSEFAKWLCPGRPAKECSLGKLYLTADAVISQTSAGSVVPFYLQPSLGGADIQGEDTLRGFRDYRFRGPSRVLYQAEFRRDLGHLPIGLLAFYDVGRVGFQASDLTSHLRHDIGTGFYVTFSNAVLVRLYVGFGSGEGIRPNVKFASGGF